MKQQQAGFTLIELVMVIVILGILAATALPKFVNLENDARLGATKGVAGSLASASSINYAACSVGNTACIVVDNCSDLKGNAVQGIDFTQYTVTDAAAAVTTNGNTIACKIKDNTEGTDVDYIVIAAGNP